MQVVRFEVSGSKGNIYEIDASREGANLIITCTCPAGQNGLYCKHRFALLDGVVDGLESDNEEDVEKLAGMVAGSDVAVALEQ